MEQEYSWQRSTNKICGLPSLGLKGVMIKYWEGKHSTQGSESHWWGVDCNHFFTCHTGNHTWTLTNMSNCSYLLKWDQNYKTEAMYIAISKLRNNLWDDTHFQVKYRGCYLLKIFCPQTEKKGMEHQHNFHIKVQLPLSLNEGYVPGSAHKAKIIYT